MDTRAPDRKYFFLSSVFFFLPLSNLFHEATHNGRRLVLFLASGVGVDAEDEARIEMVQHTGHGFDIHTILQGCSGKGVPQIMESEMLQPGLLQDFLMEIHQTVRVVHLPKEPSGLRTYCLLTEIVLC